MTRPLVVVTRAVFPETLARLETVADLLENQGDEPLAADELKRRLAPAAAALVTGADRIDRAVLDAAPQLTIVSTISVGYNHIDVATCDARGIVVTNTPDVLTETTADLGFALMMAIARRMSESERWLRAGHWTKWALDLLMGSDVHHSTLGIVGMGRIGQAIARRARGFSMKVLYHNRSRVEPALEAELDAHWVSLDELLQAADHVILVVPYSAATHHLIGARELALMKSTATLTNIARGGLIDESALCEALARDRLGGAALDVFEGEPAVRAELLRLERVVLTPHIGSASQATRRAMADLAVTNLLAALAGQKPPHQVHAVQTGTRPA